MMLQGIIRNSLGDASRHHQEIKGKGFLDSILSLYDLVIIVYVIILTDIRILR